MLIITPAIIWMSIIATVEGGVLVLLMSRAMKNDPIYSNDQAKQDEKALIALMFQGVGDICGGIIMGYAIDMISNKFALFF